MSETKISFVSQGRKLAGTVRVPDGVKPGERRPAWIVMHGFGSNSSSTNVLEPCKMFEELGYVTLRFDMPGGMVANCELGFGDSVLMMGSPMPPQFPSKQACLGIYVKDCDAVYRKALSEGSRSLQEPAYQFYWYRSARFEDPFGNEWSVITHIKDVSEREMKAAMAQMSAAG